MLTINNHTILLLPKIVNDYNLIQINENINFQPCLRKFLFKMKKGGGSWPKNNRKTQSYLFIYCQTFPLLKLLNWIHMHTIKSKNSWKKSKNAFIHWEVDFLLQMCDSKRGTGIISLKHFFSNFFAQSVTNN